MPHWMLLTLALALILGASLLRRSLLTYPSAPLLRAFLPYWRFFEQPGAVAGLRFRYEPPSGPWTDWKDGLPPVPIQWTELLVNPAGNLRLAHQSLIQTLLLEIQDLPEEDSSQLDQSVSYRLVDHLIRETVVRALDVPRKGSRKGPSLRFRYQFQVTATLPGAERAEAVLTSPEIEV